MRIVVIECSACTNERTLHVENDRLVITELRDWEFDGKWLCPPCVTIKRQDQYCLCGHTLAVHPGQYGDCQECYCVLWEARDGRMKRQSETG